MVCSSADHSIDNPGLCFSAWAGPGVAPLLGFPGTEEPAPPSSLTPRAPPARNGPPLAPSGFPDGLALAPINRKTSQPPILRNHRSLRPIRTYSYRRRKGGGGYKPYLEFRRGQGRRMEKREETIWEGREKGGGGQIKISLWRYLRLLGSLSLGRS
ncbi:hypothetical protein BHM03_00029561 [Ensete ventricosum]|nr:hypothetical protein BHM03_00029561 [Ensete ventricosum]